MNSLRHRLHIGRWAILVTSVLLFGAVTVYARHDPLPSWNNGPAKKAILTFVKETNERSSPKYVQPADRIATFDQDGTLWTEHPLYGHAMFALERVGQLAPQHPEWKEKLPFKAVLERDHEAMGKFTEQEWMEIIAATQRPQAAFGNSGGDQQMLEWTQAGDGAKLMMLVHHDDATREYAYGPGGGLPDTHVGTFSDALMSQAKNSGWIVISMKDDWKRVFAFEK